jgi:hypothetical protein
VIPRFASCWDEIRERKLIGPELVQIITNKVKLMMQNHETTPKYVGYDENKLQETKTTESKRISKVDAKQTCLRRVKSESGT